MRLYLVNRPLAIIVDGERVYVLPLSRTAYRALLAQYGRSPPPDALYDIISAAYGVPACAADPREAADIVSRVVLTRGVFDAGRLAELVKAYCSL